MAKATGRDPHKTGPIARLYDITVEIIDGTRKAMVQSGAAKAGQPVDIRLPILMHGTDLRVTIEAGPTTAMRNAVEHMQMNATEEPVTNDRGAAMREASALLAEYATEIQRGGMVDDRWTNEGDKAFFLRIGAAMRALDILQDE